LTFIELQFVLMVVSKLKIFQVYHHYKFTIGERVLVNGNQTIFSETLPNA